MYIDYEAVASTIGLIWAPFHELGHFVFGWISLNPVIPWGWAAVKAYKDAAFMSAGGTVGAFAGLLFLAEILNRKAPKAQPIVLFMWLVDFIALTVTVPADFQGYTEAQTQPLILLARLYAAAILVAILYRRIQNDQRRENARRDHARKKPAPLEAGRPGREHRQGRQGNEGPEGRQGARHAPVRQRL